MSKLCYLIKQLTRKLSVRPLFDIFFIVFFLFTTSSIFAQEKTVNGKVVDSKGAAIIGASVSVKGTNTGAITDANGSYSLKTSGPNAIIVVTFVGYSSQEQVVGDQVNINFTLVESSQQLNTVVVTALGIKKEISAIGYSTHEVGGNNLTIARDANAIDGLVGKVAGLTVGASSEFMSAPNVVLRGSSSILYVVDGVPINSDTWNISADDVESYTVLKGANAAALYGSRGVNGAIIITTKKGSGVKGSTIVEFNSTDMWDPKSFLAIPTRQNQYMYGSNYTYVYGDTKNPTSPFMFAGSSSYARSPIWGPRMEGQGVVQYNSPIVNGVRQATPALAIGNKNFFNFMENGFHNSNNLSISSSTEKYDIRASFTEVYQKGIDPNTWVSGTNGNINVGYNLTKKLRFDGDLNYNYQNSPNIPDVVYGPQSYTYMIQEYGAASFDVRDFKNYYDAPGSPGVQQRWVEYGRANNPYFMANEWLKGLTKTDVYGYGRISYAITPEMNLSLRCQVSGYNLLKTERLPTSAITYDGVINESALKAGEYREDRRVLFDNNNDLLLTYNKNITPNIYISALAGANLRTFTYNSSWLSTQHLLIPNVYDFTNSQSPLVGYNFNSGMNVTSYYYSFDIAYKKYFDINTTGREDISSVFPKNNQGYFYPSLSISSVVTDWMKLPESIISYLKLRGSWANVKGGLTSPTIGPAFAALGLSSPLGYGSSYYSSYGGPTYTNQNSYSLKSLYNNMNAMTYTNVLADADLKPYTVSTTEVGADIRLLKNRVGFEVTYFNTLNGPQIFPEQVAASTGFSSKNVNGITTQKTGWELEFNAMPISNMNGFSWEMSASYASYIEKLHSIYGNDQSVLLNDHYYKIGDRLDAIYGYKYYRAPDGSIIIGSDGLPMNPNQQGTNYKKFMGYANPDFNWSFNNKFSYKDFSLSFQFDGRVGGKIFDEIYVDMMQSGNATDLVNGALGAARLAEWNIVKANGYVPPATKYGQYVVPGKIITAGSPTYDAQGNINNMGQLTFADNAQKVYVQTYAADMNFQEPYMISRSYAMLRNVVLSYTLPKKLLAKTFIKKASISLVGKNLLYFDATKRKDVYLDQYAAGFDISQIGQARAQTDQSNGYGTNNTNLVMTAGMQTPVVRQYGFNINLTF